MRRARFALLYIFKKKWKRAIGIGENGAFIIYRDVSTIVAGYHKKIKLENTFAMEPQFVARDEVVIAGYRKNTKTVEF